MKNGKATRSRSAPEEDGKGAIAAARLTFEELEVNLAQALAVEYRRLGYGGEFFRGLGQQPGTLRAFFEFAHVAQASLDPRTAEVIALTVAAKAGNLQDRDRHEARCLRLGFSPEWITRVEALDPDEQSEQLSSKDRALQRWLLASLQHRMVDAAQLYTRYAEQAGSAEAVAAVFVVGRYILQSVIVQTLQLAGPMPEIFADGFTGN